MMAGSANRLAPRKSDLEKVDDHMVDAPCALDPCPRRSGVGRTPNRQRGVLRCGPHATLVITLRRSCSPGRRCCRTGGPLAYAVLLPWSEIESRFQSLRADN